MTPIRQAFKTASPPPRRWSGRFTNARFRPRTKKSVKPAFGHTKPHGQES